MEIIRKAHRITETVIFRSFEQIDGKGISFEFPCDKNGNIIINDMNRHNVENCQNGVFKVKDNGLKTFTSTRRISAIGRCTCGEEVSLSGFTNTCECGRDYNLSGQKLAPRSQWGEETGESLSDILAA